MNQGPIIFPSLHRPQGAHSSALGGLANQQEGPFLRQVWLGCLRKSNGWAPRIPEGCSRDLKEEPGTALAPAVPPGPGVLPPILGTQQLPAEPMGKRDVAVLTWSPWPVRWQNLHVRFHFSNE